MTSEDISAAPEDQARASARRLRIVLPGLLLALTLAALDQNIVSPALPRIVSDLGGLRLLSWVVTAFMVASTASAPLYGKLGDMYGRRPAFFVSIGIFLAGSALCGQAHSLFQLIGFRAVQGIGAGGLITLAQTTIADVVGPRERGRYQGIFAGVFAFCSVAGPLLGGIITDALSWRWIFYVNLPIGAAALGFIAAGVPRAARRTHHRIDYLGAALLIGGTVATLLVLSCGGAVFPWTSPKTLGLAVTALALFAGLFVVEHRAAEPILPPALFHVEVFNRSIGVIGLTMMAIFGTATFLPLYFQLELDASPSRAGLLMTPMMAGVIVASIVGGRAVSRTGRYRMFPIAGLLLASVGLASLGMFARMEPDAWLMGFMLGLTGLGLGLVMPNLTTAIQSAVPRENMGVATSSMAFFRSAGGAAGVAIAGAILNAVLSGGTTIAPHDSLDAIRALDGPMREAVMLAYRAGISDIFFAGAAVALVACGIAWFIPEVPLRDKE